jgi:AcrR family transcriptional regulator
MVKRKVRLNINLRRRAEIAEEKRGRTRGKILVAAFHIVGEERGRFNRVEDFCSAAGVSRGTFYNYFDGLEALYNTLADELSRDFDAAVHAVMEGMDKASERAAAAVRYYLRGAMDNPRWGWAMVHTSLGRDIFGTDVSSRARLTIQEGVESGEFRLTNAEIGTSLLLGASLSGTLDILNGRALSDYPERMARHILMAIGVSAASAEQIVKRKLPPLKPRADSTNTSPINYWAAMA